MEKWVFMIPITTFTLVPTLIIAISSSLAQHYKTSHYNIPHAHTHVRTNKTELDFKRLICFQLRRGKQLCYTFTDPASLSYCHLLMTRDVTFIC